MFSCFTGHPSPTESELTTVLFSRCNDNCYRNAEGVFLVQQTLVVVFVPHWWSLHYITFTLHSRETNGITGRNSARDFLAGLIFM